MILTKERLQSNPDVRSRPHVVILGAGATKAAIGNDMPLMEDLPEILGTDWDELLQEAQPPEGNFEATFSWIRKNGNFEPQLSNIEQLIEKYFQVLKLPDQPTIYDYLVLGLRRKDVIATFNWDPFLMQAHRRNRNVAELPDIRFLHGSVAFATCTEHDVLGIPFEKCPECNCKLGRGRLFFPDGDKDYTKDSIISRDWIAVTEKLREAFHLTIFGYSGPATDWKARKLLLDAWKQTPARDFSHAEIVDLKDKEILENTWIEFFPLSHSIIKQNFRNCSVARFPRRTAEWKHSVSINGKIVESTGPFLTKSLIELQEWFRELAALEGEAMG